MKLLNYPFLGHEFDPHPIGKNGPSCETFHFASAVKAARRRSSDCGSDTWKICMRIRNIRYKTRALPMSISPGQLERCSFCSRQFRREVLPSHEQSCSAGQPRVARAATSPMPRARSTSTQGWDDGVKGGKQGNGVK